MSIVTRSPDQEGSEQRAGDRGVEGNARLTASTGLVLLVLVVIQVGTIVVSVKTHVTLHVVVGLLLVPPLVVKITSVLWRFVSYYRHDPAYQRKGPPTPALRILGPALLIDTLVLFVSGIILLLAPTAFGGPRGVMFHVHDLSSYLWLLLVLGHLAGHAHDLRRFALGDWARRTRATVGRAPLRQAVLLASRAAGLALALCLVGRAQSYQSLVNRTLGLVHQPGAARPSVYSGAPKKPPSRAIA